ncbi:MAG: hypothetical protein II088_02095, partial [Bacteroidales bacterium]|nr:hypothetical protein [Bacteroidales bacterium]
LTPFLASLFQWLTLFLGSPPPELVESWRAATVLMFNVQKFDDLMMHCIATTIFIIKKIFQKKLPANISYYSKINLPLHFVKQCLIG